MKKETILYILLVVAISSSVAVEYYRIYISNNFQIVSEISCDPEINNCYSYESDPDGVVEYYALVSKKASSVLACEQTRLKIDCTEELSCLEGEKDCSYIYCSNDEDLYEGEWCSNDVDVQN